MTGTKSAKMAQTPQEAARPKARAKGNSIDKVAKSAKTPQKPQEVATPEGRAKGKSSDKANANVKANAKGMTPIVEVKKDKPAPTPTAKVKTNLKGRVFQDMGDLNIDEVVEEARAMVAECELNITNTKNSEKELGKQADVAKMNMEAASASVEEAMHIEAVALEKLKAARMQKLEATGTQANMRDEAAKEMLILQFELEARAKRRELEDELEDSKSAAREAAEAAKRALEKSKQKEKEILEALKAVSVEQLTKEAEVMKSSASEHGKGKKAQKEKKIQHKQAAKDLKAEMAQFEKSRLEREKLRQQWWRESAGLGSGVIHRGRKRFMQSEVDVAPSKAVHLDIGDLD